MIRDHEGLDRAYEDGHKVFATGDTLYVAGTSSLRDAADDLLIPLGLTRFTKRYSQAERALGANPKIRKVTGHSLGGAVALELASRHPGLETRTYGAPVASATKGERYRSWGDPVASLDFGAKTSFSKSLNPHSYASWDLSSKFAEGTSADGWTADDGEEVRYR
jgi:pimeloyl-ACP methyl ester carboxylesterase